MGEGFRGEEFSGLEEGFDLEEGRFGASGFFDLLEEAKDEGGRGGEEHGFVHAQDSKALGDAGEGA